MGRPQSPTPTSPARTTPRGSSAELTNGAGALLTAEDVARRWQVKPAHVYRLAREGALPAVRLGRYRRFRLESIETFESEGGTEC